MLERSTALGHPLHWFAFGFITYVVWTATNAISIFPPFVYVFGPLLFVVATCVLVMPELRTRKTETKWARRRFFCAIFGGAFGSIIGIALKYLV